MSSNGDPGRVPLALRLAPDSIEALRYLIEESLRRRRAFVAEVEEFPAPEAAVHRESCELSVVIPGGAEVKLLGEIVFVQQEGPGRGVGVTLTAPDLEEVLCPLIAACDQDESDISSFDLIPPGEDSGEADSGRELRTQNIHERMRKLSATERDRVARNGGMTERVALERCFGGVVWEGLLQNPQLSGGEVARIAKNGGAPTPLLAIIAGNAAWITRGEVRRALLGNPRLGDPAIEKLLRATPVSELKLIAQQAFYPAKVRSAASRLLKRI